MERKMIVLISGKQGAGKTTLSNKLMEKARLNRAYAYPTGFAAAMRVIVQGMHVLAKGQGCPIPEKIENRALMNFIATDWGRGMDPDFWIPPARKAIKSIQDLWKDQPFHLILIDDFRCQNEAHALDDLDQVYRIRLECPEEFREKRAKYWGSPDHFSEVDLDGYDKFDLFLNTFLNTPDENADIAYESIIERVKGVINVSKEEC